MQQPDKEVNLDSIVITSELSTRECRPPNFQAQAMAMQSLAQQLIQPEKLLQSLTQMALDLCHAGSVGVSWLTTTQQGEEVFHAQVLAGVLTQYELIGTTKRNFSPCGVCIECGNWVLLSHPERHFTYLQAANIPIVEELVIPLSADNRPLGTLWMMSHDLSQHFDSEDVRLMTSFADFAAAALLMKRQQTQDFQAKHELVEEIAAPLFPRLERTHAEVTLRESEAKLVIELADTQQLQNISSQLIQEENIDALYQEILNAALALMRSDMGSLQMLDPERQELRLLAWKGFHPDSAAYWETITDKNTTSCGGALRMGERLIVPDVNTADFLKGSDNLKYYQMSGIVAMQSTPLVSRDGRIVGMISTHWRKSHVPGDRELMMFDVLARQAADLLERKRAEVALRESEARLAADLAGMCRLYELHARLSNETDLHVALAEILATACEFTSTDRGCVQLMSDDGHRLEMYAWRGYSDDSLFIEHFRYEGAKVACDMARRHQERLMIEDIENFQALALSRDREVALAENIRAMQSTPLITRQGEMVGVLSNQFPQPHRPTEHELRLIDLLAWTAADFVARHQVEQALRESEAKYRSLFNSIDEGFCTIEVLFDEQGKAVDYRFLEMNPAFVQHTGIENGIGRTVREFAPEHEEFWFETYGHIAKTGVAMRFEHKAAALGKFYDVYAFRIGAPEKNRVAVIFNDIFARKQAEEALRESEERFRLFVTAASDIIYRMSADWSEMHTLEGKSFLADTRNPSLTWLEKYIPDSDKALVQAAIAEAVRAKTKFELEHRVIRADGTVGWTFSRAIPFLDERGEIVEWFGAASDITDRKRAQEAMRVFFSNVSHEFRTPLTLLLSSIEETLSDLADPPSSAQRSQLQLAHRNAVRLLKLVNTLLDVSRIEAGRIQAVYDPTDLATLTIELASSFESAIAQAGLQLVIDCPPLQKLVYVDRSMWEKIVLNLLSNAFKFTFAGEITVRLKLAGNWVELTVQDTGIGIAAAELPCLFERFYQVKQAKGRSFEGSGIGLSLVQELVKLHGGTITVSSVEGEGSCFVVSIPTGFAHLPPQQIGLPQTLPSTATDLSAYVEEALGWLPEEAGEQGSGGAGEKTASNSPLPLCPILPASS